MAKTTELNPKLIPVIKEFLRYSWYDINFEYSGLTNLEQKICTPEEFEELVAWTLSAD